MCHDRFRSSSTWTAWIMCWILALPLAVHAAAFSPTPHQQKMLDALQKSSIFARAWREPWLILSMEDTLRRWVLVQRCPSRLDNSRLFLPAYRRYIETVGGAFHRHLQESSSLALIMPTQQGMLWAIDQLSDAQYEHSMRLLTDADGATVRTLTDLGRALATVTENLIDASTGAHNIALLAQFKQTLIQTGQLEPILTALSNVDPHLSEAFASVEFLWPVPAEKWGQWETLAFRLDIEGERIQMAYWESWPEPVRKQIEAYREDPLFANLYRAQEASKAWSMRMNRFSNPAVDMTTLTDAERLGQKIHAYFGESKAQEADFALLQAHDWLRQQAQAYIETHKSQICGRQYELPRASQ